VDAQENCPAIANSTTIPTATLALPDLPFFSSRCRFPGCDPQGLIISAERLRGVIAESPINNTSGPIPVTISVGLVSVGAGNLKPIEHIALVQAADSALYRAKAKAGTEVLFTAANRRFTFLCEQFWGRAARASADSKESGRLLIFWR